MVVSLNLWKVLKGFKVKMIHGLRPYKTDTLEKPDLNLERLTIIRHLNITLTEMKFGLAYTRERAYELLYKQFECTS